MLVMRGAFLAPCCLGRCVVAVPSHMRLQVRRWGQRIQTRCGQRGLCLAPCAFAAAFPLRPLLPRLAPRRSQFVCCRRCSRPPCPLAPPHRIFSQIETNFTRAPPPPLTPLPSQHHPRVITSPFHPPPHGRSFMTSATVPPLSTRVTPSSHKPRTPRANAGTEAHICIGRLLFSSVHRFAK